MQKMRERFNRWEQKANERKAHWVAKQAARIERYKNAFAGSWITKIGLGMAAIWNFIVNPPFFVKIEKRQTLPFTAMLPFGISFGKRDTSTRRQSTNARISAETLEQRQLLAADITGVSNSSNFTEITGLAADSATTTDLTPTISGTATANSTIYIDDVATSVTADGTGNWTYTPAVPVPGIQNFSVMEGAVGATSFTADDSVTISVNTSSILGEVDSPQSAEPDNFGQAVAISGDRMIVAAREGLVGGVETGRVYIYGTATGTPVLHATIDNPTPDSGDLFGSNLAIDGDLLAVSAHSNDATVSGSPVSGTGSVYLFDLSGSAPALVATIDNPTPTANDFFGLSLAVHGTTLAIGTPSDTVSGIDNVGSVLLYDVDVSAGTATLTQTINSPLGGEERFGESVALTSDRLAIGTSATIAGQSDVGRVYVYDRTGAAVSLQSTLGNPTPNGNDAFGGAMALQGDVLAVAAAGLASSPGVVYVYDLSLATPVATTIANPTPTASERFGASIGLDGTRLVVGAAGDDTGELNAGSAYVYDLSAATPVLVSTLNNPAPANRAGFGYAVAVQGDQIVIGENQFIPNGSGGFTGGTGTARLFTMAPVNVIQVAAGESIQAAIDAAPAGSTIQIAEGTYVENISINKSLSLIGQGQVTLSTTNGYSIIVNTTSLSDAISISGIDFDGNSTASSGVYAGYASQFASISVSDASIENFVVNGVRVLGGTGGNGKAAGAVGQSVTLNDLTFSNNGIGGTGGMGDINLFQYNGNAILNNLTLSGNRNETAGTGAQFGIQMRGIGAGDGVSEIAMGTVSLTNIVVSGKYRTQMIGLQRYSDVSNLTFSGVQLGGAGAEITGTFGALLRFDAVGSGSVASPATVDLGDTQFNGTIDASAQKTGLEFAPDNAFAFLVADATEATWTVDGIALDPANNPADALLIENRILHYPDQLNATHTAAFGGQYKGFAKVVAGKAIVSSSGSIARAIEMVAAGGEVYLQDGTYAENIVANKSVSIIGQSEAGTIIDASGGAYGIHVTADDVTIEDLTIDSAQTFGVHTAGSGVANLTVTNVAANNAGPFESGGIFFGNGFDLNSVNGAVLTNVTAIGNGAVAGTSDVNNSTMTDRDYGHGISITGGTNVTINGATLNGNAFAGLGIYSGPTYGTTDGVTLEGTISIDGISGGGLASGNNGVYIGDAPGHAPGPLAVDAAASIFFGSQIVVPYVALNTSGDTADLDAFAVGLGLNAKVVGGSDVTGLESTLAYSADVASTVTTLRALVNINPPQAPADSFVVDLTTGETFLATPLEKLDFSDAEIAATQLETVFDNVVANTAEGQIPKVAIVMPSPTMMNPNPVQQFVNAVQQTTAGDLRAIEVAVDLQDGDSYSGLVIDLPDDVELVIRGGGATITGASPGLTVNSGSVTVDGNSISGASGALTTATDDPTILVAGGSLTVRNSTITESTGDDGSGNDYDQPAIRVTGGTVDLGTTADPGGNTFVITGGGSLIDNQHSAAISAIGNTFQQDSTAITDNFVIENEITHAVDNGTSGLVTWVDGELFVADDGSIQNAINAASGGDTINLEADANYSGNLVIDKGVSIVGPNSTTAGGDVSRADEAVISGRIDVTANDVTIKGVTVGGAGLGFDSTAVFASGVSGLTIENNIVTNTGADTDDTMRRGINLNNTTNALVTGNLINLGLIDPSFTIFTAGGGYNGDVGSGPAAFYGIQVGATGTLATDTTSNATISNNQISGAGIGVRVRADNDIAGLTIHNNTITDVAHGITLPGNSPQEYGFADVDGTISTVAITNNTFGTAAVSGGAAEKGLDAALVGFDGQNNGGLGDAAPKINGLMLTGNIYHQEGATNADGDGSDNSAVTFIDLFNVDTTDPMNPLPIPSAQLTGTNTITTGGGDDVVVGGTGNDAFNTGAGADYVDGQSGSDTFTLSGDYDDYTLSISGGVVTVTDDRSGSPNGTDTVTGVEALVFDDLTVRVVGAASELTTLQLALGAASDGDVILIEAGSYGEILTAADTDVTLTGTGVTLNLQGAITGDFETESGVDIVASGDLTIGTASGSDNITLGGGLAVGSHTVTLNDGSGITTTVADVTIASGTLVSSNTISLTKDDTLSGHGIVNAKVNINTGTIVATTGQTLTVGDGTDTAFAIEIATGSTNDGGTITVEPNATLVIKDTNGITLGKTTTVNGTLRVEDNTLPNPVTQSITLSSEEDAPDPDIPGVLSGSGTVDGDLIIDGGVIHSSSTLTIAGNVEITSPPASAAELTTVLAQAAANASGNTVTVPVADASEFDTFMSLLANATGPASPVDVTVSLTSGNDTVTIDDVVPANVKLVIDGGDGDDTFRIDPTKITGGTITVRGGTGTTDVDQLVAIGPNSGDVVFTYDLNTTGDEFAGTIGIGGNPVAVKFVGLEPVTWAAASNVTFNLPTGGHDLALTSTGTANQYKLAGTTIEDTTFSLIPGGTLTINGNSGNDKLTISALTLPSNLTIDFATISGGTDEVIIDGALSVAGDVSINAETVNINASLNTTSSSKLTIIAAKVLATADIVATDDVSITATGDITLQTVEAGVNQPLTLIAGSGSTTGAISVQSAKNDGQLTLIAATGITILDSEASTITASNSHDNDISVASSDSNAFSIEGVTNLASEGNVIFTNGGNIGVSGGPISAVDGNITISSTNSLIASNITTSQNISSGGGDISLSATGSVTTGAIIDAGSGKITLKADAPAGLATEGNGSGNYTLNGGAEVNTTNADADAIKISGVQITINGAINSGAGRTNIQSSRPSQDVIVGGNGGALGLSTDELNRITAGSIQVGRTDGNGTGSINILGDIAPALSGTLILLTDGDVVDTSVGRIGNYLSGDRNLKIVAGGDVTLDGDNDVDNLVAVVTGSGNSFTFHDTDGVTIPASANAIDGTTGITTDDGPILLVQNDLDIQSAIDAGTANVTIRPYTNTREISLGAETVGQLSLTDTELDLVMAAIVKVGQLDPTDITKAINTGNINLRGAITQADSGYTKLSLITGGAVVDQTGTEQADITVDELAIQAGGGIGTAATNGDIDVNVTKLAAHNDLTNNPLAGGIFINALGDTTIDTVDGVIGVINDFDTGSITVDVDADGTDDGVLTVNENVTSKKGSITLTADDDIILDEVTVSNGATASNTPITITADTASGDNDGVITMIDGTEINSGASKAILSADGDITLGLVTTTNAALDSIQITTTNGAVLDASETMTNADLMSSGGVVINSAAGVGTTTDAIETSIASLDITNADGPINILEATDLSIINIDQNGTDATDDAVTIVTTDGSITVAASGTGIDAEGANVALTANGTGKSINVNEIIDAAGDGTITLTAADSITSNATITSGDGDITLGATAGDATFGGTTTGEGDIITATGDITVSAASGAITMSNGTLFQSNGASNAGGLIDLSADGDITLGGLLTTNGTEAAIDKDGMPAMHAAAIIVSSATGDILDGGDAHTDIDAADGGAVLLAPNGTIGTPAVGMTPANPLEMNVNSIGALSSGDIDLVDSGDIYIDCLVSSAGNINVESTGGSINDLQDDANADLQAGPTGTISLTAITGIGGAPDTTATAGNGDADGRLELAAGSILTASTSGADANIVLHGLGDITLTSVSTTNGDIDITAAGDITATSVIAGDDGNIEISTDGTNATEDGDINVGIITADGDDVTLTAADAILDDTSAITATNLTMNAVGGVGTTGTAINTTVENLTVSNTSTGDININETKELNIVSIDQDASTTVNVVAGGTITVAAAAATPAGSGIDAENASVTLTATGTASDIVVNHTIDSNGGAVSLLADNNVNFGALGNINSVNGDVVVTADAEDPTVDTLGGITMTDGAFINSGTGTIDIDATENITLGRLVSTNTTNAAVNVTSSAGSILDGGDAVGADIEATETGAEVTLTAATGIGTSAMDRLDLAGGSVVNASVTGEGDIWIEAAGAIELKDVDTVDGDIDVSATGMITATLVVAADANTSGNGDVFLRTTAGGIMAVDVTGATDVKLEAVTGDVQLGKVTATDGDIDIDATAGSITDKDTDTDVDLTAGGTVFMDAANGIGATGNGRIDVAAGGTVDATVTGTGDIWLNSPGAVTLLDVDTADGNIDVTAGGKITATDVDAVGTEVDVTLTTTAGDIEVGDIDATGEVSLDSAANITDAASGDTDTDITGLTVTLKAVNSIGSIAERLEITTLATGSSSAQLTDEGDIALAVNSDVRFTSVTTEMTGGEIDIIGGTNEIEVAGAGMSAVGGGITIVSDDIKLSANLQTDGGDVELTGAIVVNGAAITIDTADTVTEAGDVTIDGTVSGMTADADNLTIDADATTTSGNVEITGIVGGTPVLNSLTILGENATLGAAVTVNDGGISVDASSINLGDDLTTAAGTVELTGSVILDKTGATTTIDTGAGAAVTIDGIVDGTTIGNETLVIDAGTEDVELTSTLGGNVALGGLTVTADTLILGDDVFTDGRGAGDGAIDFSAVTNLDLTENAQVVLDSDAAGDSTDTVSMTSAAGLITLPTNQLDDISEPTVDLVIDASSDDGTSQDVILKDVNVKSLSVSGDMVTFDGVVELEDTNGTNALTVNAKDVIFTANARVIAKGAGGVAINGNAADKGALTINSTGNSDAMFNLTATGAVGQGVTIDGNFTVVELGDDIATNDGAVSIASPTRLTASVSIDTALTATDGGANVTFTSTLAGSTDGTENLTIDAGMTGDISITGAIGSSTVSLGSLTITDADEVSFGSTADLSGLTVTASTTFTATGKITTSADISIVADAATGTGVTLTGGAELAGNDLVISADAAVVISANIESGTAGSTVTLQGTGDTTEINLGSGTTGGLDISETSLQFITDDIAELIVGDVAQTGTITINETGGLELNTPLTIRSTGASSNVDLKSNLTTDGGLTINGGSSGTLNVAAASIAIATQGGNVVIGEDIAYTFDASSLAIDSAGGNISLNGSVTADTTTAGGENLTLTAGTGDITLGATTSESFGATGTGRLGTISIVSADEVTVNASVTAVSFQQNAAADEDVNTAVGGTTTTFNQPIDLDGGDLRLVNVTNVTFADGAEVTTTNGGNVFLDGDDTGTLTIGTSGMTIDGSFTEQDFDAVNINGPINVGGDINLGDIVIGDHLELTAANITIGSITADQDDAFDVVLTATATVTIGQIGTDADTDDINDVRLTGPTGITLNGDIFTGEDQDDTSGSVTGHNPLDEEPAGNVSFIGPVTLGADITINTVDNNGDVTFNSTIDATTAGNESLTITVGAGDVTATGAIGTTTPLTSLEIEGMDVDLQGNVTVTTTVDVDATTADLADINAGGLITVD
ncbi:hypothetical protein RBWH47_03547, partial [Rhodopirellula baltica WH47]